MPPGRRQDEGQIESKRVLAEPMLPYADVKIALVWERNIENESNKNTNDVDQQL
jgi:hypothetical protein